MRVVANKIASVTRRLELSRELSLTPDIEAQEGAVLVGRVLGEKSVYNQLEDVHGRFSTLHEGDLIVGALGHRNALHGYEGVTPESVAVGDRLHVLNLGGVLGQCVSHNPRVGKPFEVEILGQVLLYRTFQSREGEPAFVQAGAIEAPEADVTCPVIYVAGTCMNSGKTRAACVLIRRLAQEGYRVGGAKLTGVSLLRDALAMRDYGAEQALDFTDVGCVASSPELAPTTARTIFAALASQRVDVIVAEMGDGVAGEYGVQAILEDPVLGKLPRAFVLCANDPVGARGGVRLARKFWDIDVDIISGPATDNRVGVRYVESELGIPAINARSDGQRLGDWIVGVVKGEQA